MPVQQGGEMGWWSPEPRGVLPVTGLRVSRSLRRSCARYQVTVDSCFERVVNLCADPSRPHGWIDQRIIDSFLELHQLGWAHSVETWRDEELVGGLYGVAIGGLFAGESMFHHATDASKVALVALVELLNDGQPRLIDVQWRTDHLGSLGVIEVARIDYLRALVVALGTSQPAGLRS